MMAKCAHEYRPSLRGGYVCQVCEKDINSDTYDEITVLQAEVERLTAMNVRLRDALERIESIDVVETEDAYSMGAIVRRALAEEVRG